VPDRRTFLVVLNGASGTGKSALAAVLAASYGWPVLAKDRLKDALFDALGTGDRAWSRRLSDASFEELFALTRRWCGCTPVLVLDANFRPDVHGERLSDLCAATGAGLLQVLLHAGHETLRSRFAQRAKAGARHPGHLDAVLLAEIDRDPAYFAPRPLPVAGDLIQQDMTNVDDLLLQRLAERIHAAAHHFSAACGSVTGSERRPGPPGVQE